MTPTPISAPPSFSRFASTQWSLLPSLSHVSFHGCLSRSKPSWKASNCRRRRTSGWCTCFTRRWTTVCSVTRILSPTSRCSPPSSDPCPTAVVGVGDTLNLKFFPKDGFVCLGGVRGCYDCDDLWGRCFFLLSLSVNIKRVSILPIKLASKGFAIRHVLELLVICPWFIAIKTSICRKGGLPGAWPWWNQLSCAAGEASGPRHRHPVQDLPNSSAHHVGNGHPGTFLQ